MEDFDNGGPAVKAACLVCTGPPDLGSRAAAVNVEITNVVRPIVGDADFAEGGNKSEARSVLRGGELPLIWHELGFGGICMPDTPLLSCAGQGTLEIITSRGGLLTLRAHPAFSFLAPSASLTVPSLLQAVVVPAAFAAACSCAFSAPSVLGVARAGLLAPCPHIRAHGRRRVGARCALSSSGPPNPV
jgi:hypothetical protein